MHRRNGEGSRAEKALPHVSRGPDGSKARSGWDRVRRWTSTLKTKKCS
nr:MAG TPA: hypothetical protein [Caudoviricetes sp.]